MLANISTTITIEQRCRALTIVTNGIHLVTNSQIGVFPALPRSILSTGRSLVSIDPADNVGDTLVVAITLIDPVTGNISIHTS